MTSASTFQIKKLSFAAGRELKLSDCDCPVRPHASPLAAGGPAANGNCFDPQGCFPFSPTNILRGKVHSLAGLDSYSARDILDARANLSILGCLLRTSDFYYPTIALAHPSNGRRVIFSSAAGLVNLYFRVRARRGLVQVVNLILAAKASH